MIVYMIMLIKSITYLGDRALFLKGTVDIFLNYIMVDFASICFQSNLVTAHINRLPISHSIVKIGKSRDEINALEVQ